MCMGYPILKPTAVLETLNAVINTNHLEICLPSKHDENKKVRRGFVKRSNDLNCGTLGAIDGFFQKTNCRSIEYKCLLLGVLRWLWIEKMCDANLKKISSQDCFPCEK